MTLILNGTTGISGVDGSSGTPAYQGNDANTGISFGTDIVTINTGGTARVTTDASGNVGIGTASPGYRLDVAAGDTTANLGYAVRLRSNATATAATLQFTNSGVTTENGYIRVTDTGLMSFSDKAYITSAGNVGIGTASPTSVSGYTALNIKSTNGGELQLGNTAGTAQATFWADASGITYTNYAATSHIWVTAASEKMRILSGGNVGIGTTSPQAKLAVSNGGAAGLEFFVNYPGGGVGTYIQSYNRSSPGYVNTAYDAADHSFRISGTEKMFLNSSGNLGIGTGSPNQRLQVTGSNGTGFAGATLQNSNANVGLAGVQFSSDTTYSKSAIAQVRESPNGVGPLVFYVDSATDAADWAAGDEKMRISAAGNLLVGTTNNFGKLSVFGTAGFNADANSAISGSGSFKFRGAAGATTITTWDYLNYTAMQFIRDNGNPTNTVGSITCTDTATSYNTSSDYRLKENVQPMQGALATVAALKPVTYTWKANGSDGQGFIAHELQAVVPDCVTGEKDAVDKDGKPQYQGVDTSFLVATVVAALQELKTEVDSLKAQLQGAA